MKPTTHRIGATFVLFVTLSLLIGGCYDREYGIAAPEVRILDFGQKSREVVKIQGEISSQYGILDEIGIKWGVLRGTEESCDEPLADECIRGTISIDPAELTGSSESWIFEAELDYGFNNYDRFWFYTYVVALDEVHYSNVVNVLMRSHSLVVDAVEDVPGDSIKVGTLIGVVRTNVYAPFPKVAGLIFEEGDKRIDGADPRDIHHTQDTELAKVSVDLTREQRYLHLKAQKPAKHDSLKTWVRSFTISEYRTGPGPNDPVVQDTTYSFAFQIW